jgi:hypothetical protein
MMNDKTSKDNEGQSHPYLQNLSVILDEIKKVESSLNSFHLQQSVDGGLRPYRQEEIGKVYSLGPQGPRGTGISGRVQMERMKEMAPKSAKGSNIQDLSEQESLFKTDPRI